MQIRKILTGSVVLYAFWAVRFVFGSVSVTLLHTNDLHSHFREEKGPLGLGGVARLKTEIMKLRKEIPNTLLVDAGDWSEGNIYYTEGAGEESLRMMDHLGFDVAVVGNHDWLNGPDHLLDTFEKVNPTISFISSNLLADHYSRMDEFHKWILPYVVRQIDGAKIAFIGVSTFEYIYDKFINPIEIQSPYEIVKTLSEQLKAEGDAVVVISHNSIATNKKILQQAPSVDLLISGHEHVKLTKPILVARNNSSPAWLVEAECWGKYLGRVDLRINSGQVELLDDHLIQIDSRIPEDPETLSKIKSLEETIEKHLGPVFQDVVGETKIALNLNTLENGMGDIVTDAYLKKSHADFSLEVSKFITSGISRGVIHSADLFNAVPSIYSATNHKTWTLKTIPISGRHLKWALYLIFATNKLLSYGMTNISGLTFAFDPLFLSQSFDAIRSMGSLSDYFLEDEQRTYNSIESLTVLQDIRIQGQPLDLNKQYSMATGGGVIEAIDFIDKRIWNMISLDQLKDTGIENWLVLKDYLQSQSPLDSSKLILGNRIRTVASDLGLDSDSIGLKNKLSEISVRVKNYGLQDSSLGAKLMISLNKNGRNTNIDPDYVQIGSEDSIPILGPGAEYVSKWSVELPKKSELFSITAKLNGVTTEVNHTNDEITQWF